MVQCIQNGIKHNPTSVSMCLCVCVCVWQLCHTKTHTLSHLEGLVNCGNPRVWYMSMSVSMPTWTAQTPIQSHMLVVHGKKDGKGEGDVHFCLTCSWTLNFMFRLQAHMRAHKHTRTHTHTGRERGGRGGASWKQSFSLAEYICIEASWTERCLNIR